MSELNCGYGSFDTDTEPIECADVPLYDLCECACFVYRRTGLDSKHSTSWSGSWNYCILRRSICSWVAPDEVPSAVWREGRRICCTSKINKRQTVLRARERKLVELLQSYIYCRLSRSAISILINFAVHVEVNEIAHGPHLCSRPSK